MAKFIIQRAVYGIVLLWIASMVIFSGLRVTPGSVTDQLVAAYQRHYQVENLEEKLGLNKPWHEQYLIFMGNLLKGDPGLSLITGAPINRIVREAGIKTLILGAAGAFLTYITAIPLGVMAAHWRNSPFDQGTMLLAVLGMGIPNFFLALVLIQFLAVENQWLPVAGASSFKHLILPAVVLSAEAIALNLRLMRSSMLEELNREYIRTLYAKGVPTRRIIWVHAFRNALPPVIALAGVLLRTLIGYTLIVEVIFRWPGLGSQLVESILDRDYTQAQTLALMLTAAVVLFNFLADIGQHWADPRVREQAYS